MRIPMKVLPCPLCGYDAPDADPAVPASCPHCGLTSADSSLRDKRPTAFGGIATGLAAMPRGLYYLSSTPRVKRWLIPPLMLTVAAFVGLFWWFWSLVSPLIEKVRAQPTADLQLPEGWWDRASDWLLRSAFITWLAQASGVLVFLVVSSLAGLWAFSIVYEAIAGPFLDEIHGRLERRWFGKNPRDDLQRPTQLPAERCARISAVLAVLSLAAVGFWYWKSGWQAWTVLVVGVPLPFLVAALVHREYGKWLRWVIQVEGGTLWVSVKAAIVAGLILLFFLPLKLVPVLGYVLFGGAAGFTTALSLLDIPFSRRQWSLRARISFTLHQLPAVVAYGVVASLLFVIPVIGPVVMVPAASVGGLWLVCRLDKGFMRRSEGPSDPAPRARIPAP